MKFGIFLAMHYPDPGRPYGQLLDEAMEMTIRADELGYDAVFIPEHHFINYITMPSALMFAVQAAARTKRIRFVTAILVTPFYHPMALAELIAQADWMTGGRLEAGVARGGNSYEWERLGIDYTQSRSLFTEGLEVMLRGWNEDAVTYNGHHWQFPRTHIIPKPMQKPHPPIWITAQSLNGARGAAEFGYNMLTMPNYNSFAPFEDLPALLAEYRAAGGCRGEDVALARKTFIAPTQEEANLRAPAFLKHWQIYMSGYKPPKEGHRLDEREDADDPGVVAGGFVEQIGTDIDLSTIYDHYDDPLLTTPAKAVERIRTWQGLGINYLVTNTAIGIPHADVMSSIELFARDVMPHFRDGSAERGAAAG